MEYCMCCWLQAETILQSFSEGEEKLNAALIIFTRLESHCKLEGLSPRESKWLRERLGVLGAFRANNPTGHYELSLSCVSATGKCRCMQWNRSSIHMAKPCSSNLCKQVCSALFSGNCLHKTDEETFACMFASCLNKEQSLCPADHRNDFIINLILAVALLWLVPEAFAK